MDEWWVPNLRGMDECYSHKFIGWMNDASYKYTGVVGNMDAKSPKNAGGWMDE